MKCVDCGYYWKEDYERVASCHFVGPEGWAPCEVEDNETEDD